MGNDISGESLTVLSKMMNGKIPMVPDTAFPMVDVRDVAKLHVQAILTKGTAGKRFIAAGTDPIGFADVADNAVTLAKMASGTDGNIISYDASGNPVAVATGSDGQVLTSTGAGSPPAFEALPAGEVNTPAFMANIPSNQTIGTGAYTLIWLSKNFDPPLVL